MLDYPEINIDSSDVIGTIREHGEKIICKKGTSIITPHSDMDTTYFIEHGNFAILLTDEKGNNLILKIDESDGFISLEPLFIPEVPLVINATALTDSIVYKLEKATINSLLDNSKIFRYYLIKHLCSNEYKNFYHSILLSLNSNKEKLYNFLLIYADYENPIENNWYRIKLQYKQQEIADYLGITRITVWKVMNELAEEGLVRTINKKIQIRLKLNDKNK